MESHVTASAETNLSDLSETLLEAKIISAEEKEKLDSLDRDYLDSYRTERYMNNLLHDRIREDNKVYDRLVRIIHRAQQGIGNAIRKELHRFKRGNTERTGSVFLTREHIPDLLNIIVSSSHKWEEIGIALGLPDYVREECRNCHKNILKLNKTLEAWIAGDYEGAKAATLDVLKEALSCRLVALHDVSQKLSTFHQKVVDPLQDSNKALHSIPEICYQSYNVKVAEGKSTLLEVEVCSNGCEYQWIKDGQPLFDGSEFSGVSNDILYVNKASIDTEGKYSCLVRNGSDSIYSDKIKLTVIYPPEKEHLMKLYSLIKREVPEDSWPPRGTSKFINLVLIKQSATSKVDYYTVRGDMDDILGRKDVVKYGEVFREYRERELLLVEGRPGCGKTTLVNKLARDWASGLKVLVGVKIVFLITLRNLNLSGKDKSILQILEGFYDSEVLRKEVEADLQKGAGRGACFIIDGLDEYKNNKTEQSVIHLLIHKKCFPFSMVIVASRPVATDALKKRCTRRIEVLGFNKSQIKEYIETYPFHGSSEDVSGTALRLKTYLDHHPNILYMCYLPVHAAMICFLFSQLKDKIPHTETQIYEEFTKATLLRQKTRNEERHQLKSLEDLCDKEKEDFKKICELAYNMTIRSLQVVHQSMSSVSFSKLTYSVLGLLTVEQTSEVYGAENLYTFFHLTFQEFLAALYLSRLGEEEQQSLASELEITTMQNMRKFYCGLLGLKKSQFLENASFYKSFFPCVDFFGKRIVDLPLDFVQCAFESQQVQVCEYLLETFCLNVSNTFISHSDFVALGYVITTATKCVSELVFHNCIWDYDGATAFSLMDTGKKLHSIKCLSVDIHQKNDNRSINGLLIQLPHLEFLNINHTTVLNNLGIEQLTDHIELSNLTILKVRLPMTPCSHPVEVLKSLAFRSRSLKHVYVEISDFHELDSVFCYTNYALMKKWFYCAFNFPEFFDSDISWLHLYNSEQLLLTQQNFIYCTEVVLVNCGIDDEGAEILATTLKTSILENLVLDFNRVSDSGAVAIARYMAKCSAVQRVSIQCNSIGDSGAKALADALVDCRRLRILDLQGNTLGDEGAMVIAKAAEGLLNLVVYLCNENIADAVVKILELTANIEIRTMVFNSSWDGICDAGIDALRSALKCGRLPALKICKSNISSIAKLVTEVEHIRNIRELLCDDLSDDNLLTLNGIVKTMNKLQHLKCAVAVRFSSTGSAQLLSDTLKMCTPLLGMSLRGLGWSYVPLEAIKGITNLQSLGLSKCNIGPRGVASLFSDHKPWVNLHTLRLESCNIHSNDTQVLSKVLLHCNNLRFLDLSHNYIDENGCLYLAEGLKNHTSLLELRLGRNGLNDIISLDVAALMPLIGRNQLQHLDLSRCKLGSVAVLVDAICGDSLQKLELSGCDLDLNDALELSTGLKSCGHLVELDISYNNIDSIGMSSLVDGLQYCTNLQALDIRNNYITSDGVDVIANILRSCRYLRRLCITGNTVSATSIYFLIVEWKHTNTLRLDIGGFGEPHDSNLSMGERCCDNCSDLLEAYYNNDYILINIWKDRNAIIVPIPKRITFS